MTRDREWTLSAIHSELRRLAVAGEDLGHDASIKARSGLVSACRAHCGSWLEALESAVERYPQVEPLRSAYDAASRGAASRLEREPHGDGVRVRELRVEHGWSQAELARRTTAAGAATGLDIMDRQSDVSNWERGRYAVPPRVWEAFAAPAPAYPMPAPRGPGRPANVIEPVAGLSARDAASVIVQHTEGREPTPGESRAIGYAWAGSSDLGILRLDALLAARPEIEARDIVRELAARQRAHRGQR